MTTAYTGIWNMKDVYRGDSINSSTISIKDTDTLEVLIPKSVCLQFRDKNDNLIYNWIPTILSSGKVVFPPIPKEDTQQFPVGVLKFDIEFTRPDDKVRTYVSGKLRILEDVSRC